MNQILLTRIITDELAEDIGIADLTTDSIFDASTTKTGTFTAKASGVLAGLESIQKAYEILGDSVRVSLFKKDGDLVAKGEQIATVEGCVRSLLKAERTILNLIQHLSGIATSTNQVVQLLDDPTISVVDTRKTLPGLRGLQKYAVTCGGGKNHRFRLDDGVMIKDNHIKAMGSITKAVEVVKSKVGHMVKVEVETETQAQVLEAIEAGADVIMLDNRSPEEVKKFVGLIPKGIIVEVSGGITPDNIATYKGCGAHIISLGWLTHSVKALDISFNLNL